MDENMNTAPALDNLEADENVGNEEIVEDTEDTGTESSEQEQQVQQGEQRLYAGKYKSVEELEKAYQNMVKQDTKLAQQLAELRKPQQGTQPQMPPQQGIPAGQVNPYLQQIAPILLPIVQQVQQMQEQQQQIAMQTEVSRLRMEYDDFDELAPIIPKLFEATPALFNLPNPVETAYLIAKSQYAQGKLKEVYDEATKQAYQTKDEKRKAMTESQKAKSTKEISPEEAIAEEIVSAATKGGSIFG